MFQAVGQMKIGNNPTQIHKSSILELESNQQGLLLTRISDFSAINTAIGADNVDGMVVYFTGTTEDGPGLYMRKDNAWIKIASAADAAKNWSLKGNADTDPATDFIGTTDNQPLIFKTNNTSRLTLTADGKIITTAVGSGATGDLNVLLIQADGTIVERTLPADVFSGVITGITDGTTTISNSDVTLKADASNTNPDFEVKTDATAHTATIKAPIMDGTGTQTYGFMTKTDWDKLNKLAGINGLSIGSLILSAANDPVTSEGAKITDDGNGNYAVHLVEADATHNGVVTTNAQTFAGDKTFNGTLKTEGNLIAEGTSSLVGNVTVGTSGTGGTVSNLEVTGATTLDGDVILGHNLNAANLGTDNASQNVLVKDGSGNIKTRSLDISAFKPLEFNNAGTDLTIDETSDPAKTLLNVPDAAANARGVVSVNSQEFAGAKTFINDLAVGTGGAAANLTVAGDASVSGNTTVAGTLGVTGATTLNNTLEVDDNATLKKTVYLTTAPGNATADVATNTFNVLVRNSSTSAVEQTAISADAGKALAIGTEAGTEKDLHLDRTTDPSTIIIQAPDASADVRGIVNAGTQTFGGDKTFNGNTTIGDGTTAANLTVNGAVSMATASVSGTYDLNTATNAKVHTLLVDASGGAVSITLPSVGNVTDGVIYTVTITKNTPSMNDVVVSGGTFSDGNTSMKFWNPGSSRTIQYTGGKWYVIGQ
jgi:hypothetical protein